MADYRVNDPDGCGTAVGLALLVIALAVLGALVLVYVQ